MPPVIIAVIAYALDAITLASLIVTIALYAVSTALAPKPRSASTNSNQASGNQQVIRSSIEPRRLLYGTNRVAGPLAYAGVTGTNNEFLHLVVPLATHECNAITAIYFNDVLVGALDGAGNVTTGQFTGFARVKIHLGQAGQVADADLVAEDATHWTVNHIGNGVCYLYVRLTFDRNVFPTGIPNISAVVQGAKVFDPRTSTTAFSNNWALCVRDYLTSNFGLKATAGEIDDTAFIAAANLADENVALAVSGTEKRYTCDGVIRLDGRRIDVIQAMLSAGVGNLVYSQGLYKLYGGAYRTPVVTLTDADLAGDLKVAPRIARQSLYNAVRGTFVDPNRAYQSVDFPPVVNATYQTEDGGEQIFRDIDLPFTNTPSRAQRLAKIWLERSRQSISWQALWKPKAFKVAAMDNIGATIALLGWSAKPFTVTEWRLQANGSINMSFQEENSNVYNWSTTDQTTISTVAATNLPSPFLAPAVPASVTLDSSATQQVVTTGGQIVSRIKVAWTAPADIYVRSGGKIQIQAKLSVDSVWTNYPAADGIDTFGFVAPVHDGLSYDVRVRSINTLGVVSAWVTITNHIVVGKANFSSSENLIPNGNSEAGTDALGLVPEGNGLVNDVANAFEGNWCRKMTIVSGANNLFLTNYIPVQASEIYYMEGQVKASATLAVLEEFGLQVYDASKTIISNIIDINVPGLGTAYVKQSGFGIVPPGAVWARVFFFNPNTANADNGKSQFIDALILKRSTKIEHLAPGVAASVNSSWYDDFGDLTPWRLNGFGSLANFSVQSPGDSLFGGTVGRAVNGVLAAVHSTLIPFDPNVLYRVVARARTVLATTQGSSSFTGTNGTALPTADTNWTRLALLSGAGQNVIIANNRGRAQIASASTVNYHLATAAADYQVSADFVALSFITDNAFGVLGRLDIGGVNNTAYYAYYLTGNWLLQRNLNGVGINLGTVAVTLVAGNTYNIRLAMSGSLIAMYVNGVLIAQVINTDITATGRGGIYTSNGTTAPTDTTGVHVDNFKTSTNDAEYFGLQCLDVNKAVLGEIRPAANGQVLFQGAGWTDFVGYVKGYGAASLSGPANSPAAPMGAMNGTAFVKPLFYIGYNNAGSTTELDQFTVEALANPQAWIDTGNLNAGAATDVLSTTGASVVVTADNSIPVFGHPLQLYQNIATISYTPPFSGDLVAVVTGLADYTSVAGGGARQLGIGLSPLPGGNTGSTGPFITSVATYCAGPSTTNWSPFAMSLRKAVVGGVAFPISFIAAKQNTGVGDTSNIQSYELKIEMIKR